MTGPGRTSGAAWLLAQVGAHAAARFAERLSALDLTPPHAGVLRLISASEGISQQALARALEVLPSRLVQLLDELEHRGLVERRANPDDRRLYALHLTRAGKKALEAVGRVGAEHEDALCKALSAAEREQLVALLRKIADDQGLRAGVHPGFRRLGGGSGETTGGRGDDR